MSDDLKPCPFCGSGLAKGPGRYTQASFSGVEVMDDLTNPYVWCGTCCARTLTCDSVAEAIAAWNTRATPAPHDVQGLIKRLRHFSQNTSDEYLHELAGRSADALAAQAAEIARLKALLDDARGFAAELVSGNRDYSYIAAQNLLDKLGDEHE